MNPTALSIPQTSIPPRMFSTRTSTSAEALTPATSGISPFQRLNADRLGADRVQFGMAQAIESKDYTIGKLSIKLGDKPIESGEELTQAIKSQTGEFCVTIEQSKGPITLRFIPEEKDGRPGFRFVPDIQNPTMAIGLHTEYAHDYWYLNDKRDSRSVWLSADGGYLIDIHAAPDNIPPHQFIFIKPVYTFKMGGSSIEESSIFPPNRIWDRPTPKQVDDSDTTGVNGRSNLLGKILSRRRQGGQ